MDQVNENSLPIRWEKILPFLLPLAGILVYANSLAGEFVFDDETYIREKQAFRHLWTQRPLVNLSLMLNHALDSDNEPGYHLFNIVVHVIASMALYGIVRRTLMLRRFAARFEPVAPWLAGAVAGLWLVHPLMTQAVNYVIQRAESMMGMFYLLTLYCALRGFTSRWSSVWYVLATILCTLGMASKEVMVSVPLLVLIFDRTFIAGSFAEALRTRKGLYVGLATTWIFLAVLLASGTGTLARDDSVGFAMDLVTPWTYLYSQSQVICHYLRLSVWPSPLVFDYMWIPASNVMQVAPFAAIVLVLLLATTIGLWRRSWLGVLGAWFFFILAPTSSFVPIADLAVEHRMYLPLIAVITFIVIVVWLLLSKFVADPNRSTAAGIALAVVAVFLATGTIKRNRQYRTGKQLWSTVVEHRPDNVRALHSLAVYHFRDRDFEEAKMFYDRVLERLPEHVDALLGRGSAWLELGKVEEAEADLNRCLSLGPNNAKAHYNLGVVMMRSNRMADAELRFRNATKLDPKYMNAFNNLGAVLVSQKKLAEAEQVVRELITLDPDSADAHLNLGKILLDQGRVEEGVAQYRLASQRARRSDRYAIELALVCEQYGYTSEAIEAFERSMEIRPDAPGTKLRLALLLATHPDEQYRDGYAALALTEQARKMAGFDSPPILDTYAAALAEVALLEDKPERFELAVEVMKEAIRRAELVETDPQVLQNLQAHLELYINKKPLRHDPTKPDELLSTDNEK